LEPERVANDLAQVLSGEAGGKVGVAIIDANEMALAAVERRREQLVDLSRRCLEADAALWAYTQEAETKKRGNSSSK
jgi:hypothetical protein